MDEHRARSEGSTQRLLRAWRIVAANEWTRIIGAALVVGAVLAASGGFGTGAMRIVPRLAYWLAMFLVGTGFGRLAARRLVPRPWLATRRWAAIGLISLAVGAPMTLVVAASQSLLNEQTFNPALLLQVFPSTFGVGLGMTVLAFMVLPRPPGTTHTAPPGAPPPRFLARLPPRLAGASLWAVEAQDHYLRLHTSRGEDLILFRLADAVAELEGVEGARTHRSWWVARDAVVSVERADGRASLTLIGGQTAPVSRAYLKGLRDAGWFD